MNVPVLQQYLTLTYFREGRQQFDLLLDATETTDADVRTHVADIINDLIANKQCKNIDLLTNDMRYKRFTNVA